MMYLVKIILKYCITPLIKWSSSKPATLFGLAPYLHTLINLFESIYSLYAALFHIINYNLPCQGDTYTHISLLFP